MQSKWAHLKEKVIRLRKKGYSLTQLNKDFGVPKATLHEWFKNLELSDEAKTIIRIKWLERLRHSRKYAVHWHNTQKEKRLVLASLEAQKVLANLNREDNIAQLTLALLYMGEGAKGKSGTAMGNSDPLVLRFFIILLVNVYDIPVEKIRADLHLRADQNAVKLKRYWSKALDLPIKNFRSVIFDKRTIGRPTYPGYNGVCLITCGSIHVQRRLVFMSRLFCQKIINKYSGT